MLADSDKGVAARGESFLTVAGDGVIPGPWGSPARAVSGLSAPEVHCRIVPHERGQRTAASEPRHEGTV